MKKNSPLLTTHPQRKQATSAPDSPVKKIHLREYTRSKPCFPSCVPVLFRLSGNLFFSPFLPSFFFFFSSFLFFSSPPRYQRRANDSKRSGLSLERDGGNLMASRCGAGTREPRSLFRQVFSTLCYPIPPLILLLQTLLLLCLFLRLSLLLRFSSILFLPICFPDPLYSQLSVAIYSRDYVSIGTLC